MIRVRLWGVRGSVPYSTRESMRHGCNTACIEVVHERTQRRLIIDAGSGIVGLGDTLGASGDMSVLLTHYHWDHIQGLPHFSPLFSSTHRVTVWAPNLEGVGSDIRRMFAKPFFPVDFDELASHPTIRVIDTGHARIEELEVTALPLNHPGGAFAYRVRGGRRDVVCATDHEFGDGRIDSALAAFAANAGVLILDAHYTPDEHPQFKGWGHSDWMGCAHFAKRCGVDRLLLAHHKPGRTDDDLDRIEASACEIFPSTSAAREGEVFLL